MQFPTISQYTWSVADPAGLTSELGEFSAEQDNYGDIKIRTGNNACVFRIFRDEAAYMLKCYTRPRSGLREIYGYIARSRDPLFPSVGLLPGELYVFDHFGTGSYYDVVCGEWVEGPTLDTLIGRASREGDTVKLSYLSRAFDALALELLEREWAHGDLKPENIVVRPDGSLRLIDFDALYFPGNPNTSFREIGTPGFQHPLRSETVYSKAIDDYPVALLSVSLKALSLTPELYGEYNRSDVLLMNPAEVIGGRCEAYGKIKKILARESSFSHYSLALMLASGDLCLPGLKDVFRRLAPGREPVLKGEPFFREGRFGYAASGEETEAGVNVEPVFEEAHPFREGIALVTIEGEKKLLTEEGRFLFGELKYDDIKPLSEGLAAICLNGKWGFIDRKGNLAVEPSYEAAGSMHGGAAPVMRNGRWGYIGPQGRLLTGFGYEKAFGVRGGIARVWKDGKIMELDLSDDNTGRDNRLNGKD